MNVVIANYGVGNLASLRNMVAKLGHQAVISDSPSDFDSADFIILPGVGSFDYCMKSFNHSGLRDVIERQVLQRDKKCLGVCVGMQMMFEASEEGVESGLGWVNGKVVRFGYSGENPLQLAVPHMGWNSVAWKKDLFCDEELAPHRFYFVHSYHATNVRAEDVWGVTNYGGDFVSAINADNIYATQFHPEKSHRFGFALLNRIFSECEGHA